MSNLDRLYKATPEVEMPTVLNRLNYGLVKFWERPLWRLWVKDEKERGTFVPLEGQGVNSSFMEATDGSHVHLTQQREILDEAHVSWRTMRSFEIPLKSYKRMPAPEVDYFRARMVVKCPELQLCTSHWKADEIWRENFTSWNQKDRKDQKDLVKISQVQNDKANEVDKSQSLPPPPEPKHPNGQNGQRKL